MMPHAFSTHQLTAGSRGPYPSLLPWWLFYLAFVIYGSLVPLGYRPIPLDKAWAMFQQIRLLDVGAGGRADWVANGVLYVPVGFLTASLLGGRHRALPPLVQVGAVAFAVMLALVVEFVQLAFPPRTVSLNDVLAEFIGGALGAGLAGVAAHRFRALLAALVGSADRLAPRLLKAYALGYCAFSLFPYDFLLSMGELAAKLHSDHWGWLWAGAGGRGIGAAAVAKQLAEALAALPLGWLLAARGASPGKAFGAGAALGAIIEFAQFFLVSGVAQGFSVLTRALGLWAGAVAWQRRAGLDPLRLAAGIRRFGLPLMGLYFLGLVAVTGWFELPWQGPGAAAEVLRELRFLPFYYHYYTTEQAALLSLTSVGLMYAPLGIAAWALFLGPGVAAGLAATAAAGIETSKLFLVGLHPDPTNVLLASIAAWAGCRLAMGAEGMAIGAAKAAIAPSGVRAAALDGAPTAVRSEDPGQGEPATGRAESRVGHGRGPSARNGKVGREADIPLRKPGWKALAGLFLVGALAAWGVVSFPAQPVLLGLGLAGYGLLLWFRPHYLWVAVPAALALLDLVPWSGRFYFDEFDLLLLVSVAVVYVRLPPVMGRRDPVLTAVLVLVGAFCGIAVLRGLLPWQMPDINSFNNYYSPFNALRVAKGALWGTLLIGLTGRFAAAGVEVVRLFGWGMVLGLTGTVAVVVWERAAFPGLFNFSDVYRVTGPFSQMHTGEADIESYLTAAVPFLVLFLMERRAWSERIVGLALLVGASYAVMVTFSRAGYAGFAVASLVALASGVGSAGAARPGWRRRGAVVAVLVAAASAVMIPILLSPFAQERLARVGEDFKVRRAHWSDALAMRDPGLATRLFGMGLGRFPETHYWRSTEPHAASYRLGREGDDTFLRLGSGSPLYVEQFVAVQPRQDYTLSLTARSPQGVAQVSVSLCEKWLLTSARCVFQTLDVPKGAGWQALRTSMPTGEVGGAPWYAPRPVKLSIYNANPNGVVDVDQVRLVARDGTDLLANGGFSDGLDRWFFSVDEYLPWHISSVPVTVLFEQGWLGVLALGLFGCVSLWRGICQTWRGNKATGGVLAASLGLVILGSVDSLVDSPRIVALLFVLFALCGRKWDQAAKKASVAA
jgi:VanZ like protein